MTYYEVPLRKGIYSFYQNVVLDNVLYRLTFHYNLTMDRWLMDISDAAGTAMLAGIVLVPSYPLTQRFVGRIENFPSGSFVLLDETGAERTPSKDDLGQDIKLIYVSEA
jgi:hypothetical protein